MSDFMSCAPDCLVLKIEEIERDTKKVDTNVYVLFDQQEQKYIVRGQRRWTPKYQSCTYSFDSEHMSDLIDFLQYIICRDNIVNEVLYNYDNLPHNSNEITYEFLHHYDHADYELSGYDNKKLSRRRLSNILRMLRTISNKY